ncbi:hypothetical protein K474DRAFT_1655490 [Panus rudis PR-1116 ss-1]|nr:hypothetical protein K474DRAFT_1655490 [Panus rudis PR-1116 ss-1]
MAQARVQSPAAMVDFPSQDARVSALAPQVPDTRCQPSHLPFRRISLPSAPSLLHRHSVVSTASFDSLPEDRPLSPPPLPPAIREEAAPVISRSSSAEASRRHGRRREVKILDQQRIAKRRKITEEFLDTERTYVDGLELIYSHFLMPIITSLDTSQPLLDRAELTSVFSNFIDIWNLHRSFYSSLSSYLQSSTLDADPPSLSPLLLSHFPYLSLYTPFIASFSDSLTAYSTLLCRNQAFAAFIARQEADPRCGKLKLRDWLLTIVQRCPRYLLLLKDLRSCLDQDDPEYIALTSVYELVSKITVSLNTSLHTHAQTLSLLALQRSTAGLPFQLISPGRTLLKRATLLQLEGSSPKEREFLLFSDCLLWLSGTERVDEWQLSEKWDLPLNLDFSRSHIRPPMVRTRSKSNPDVPQMRNAGERKESAIKLRLGSPSKKKVRYASSGVDDKWVYKGHLELVDLEVVLAPSLEVGDERRLEILSPQSSFALYTSNEEERDEWITIIRNAKASLLVAMNAIHPNTTLTSSSSTHHLRRTLQALPYSVEDEGRGPKRVKVEHFVPAIWIPDGKTDSCMRCGRTFGWRRRRHHCRLCGRCVCASCSSKTFYIVDPSSHSQKAARACEACYEAVFPILDPAPLPPSSTATISHLTLSGLKSMPSLLLSESQINTPSALMSIDLDSPRRSYTRTDSPSPKRNQPNRSSEALDDVVRAPAIRVRPVPRPRSYVQILEDFKEDQTDDASPISASPATSRMSSRLNESFFVVNEEETSSASAGQAVRLSSTTTSSMPPSPRKEDTVRRHKRFSLPAIAVQTTPVTARANLVGEGSSKRFSLVLGKSTGNAADEGSGSFHGVAIGKLNQLLGRK